MPLSQGLDPRDFKCRACCIELASGNVPIIGLGMVKVVMAVADQGAAVKHDDY